jgi:hypothetical protein
MLQCSGNIPVHLLVMVTLSAGKVMLTVFLDYRSILLAHFRKRGENVNSASYCEVLLKLWDEIHRKYLSQLSSGVLLYYDNARSHRARAIHERIQELQWELLEHPPYIPDMALSDFHLFDPLKTTLVANGSLITKSLKRRCGSG